MKELSGNEVLVLPLRLHGIELESGERIPYDAALGFARARRTAA